MPETSKMNVQGTSQRITENLRRVIQQKAGLRRLNSILIVTSLVSSGLTTLLDRVGERLAKTLECLGRLKALDASVLTGSRADTEIATEYENILRTYGDVLR